MKALILALLFAPIFNSAPVNPIEGGAVYATAPAPVKQITTTLAAVQPLQPVYVAPVASPVVSAPSVGCVDPDTTMAAAGIAPSDYTYVDYIVSHEGSWCGTARYNSAGSGAYGLCQSLPGNKMASAGADWATNPVTQLRWCASYAAGKGGWYASYLFWVANNWW